MNTEEFIEKSNQIHGDKYSYDECVYRNVNTKVKIICPTHGIFEQIPKSHLKGYGCKLCGYIKNKKEKQHYTTELVIDKFNSVHSNRYDYSEVVYKKYKEKVCIICPQHGKFQQTPFNHLQGQGCPKCSGNTKHTKEDMINQSKSVWGKDIFDYSECEYNGKSGGIIGLICKKHNYKFNQSKLNHLRKQISCPECFNEIYNRLPDNYWVYEKCVEISKKYITLFDFKLNEPKCYNTCKKKKWLKKFTWLKRTYDNNSKILTEKKHCIYKYEFPEYKSVYIGLTINPEQRDKQHHTRGSLHNFCISKNITNFTLVIIKHNITPIEAKELEKYWIDHYKSIGYNLINKTKGGDSLGSLGRVVNKLKQKQYGKTSY